MNRKVMQRLIWKDARTLSALALATLFSIVAFNVLLVLLVQTTTINSRGQLELARAIWFLMPSLLAFGAPAMLVGNEEESGSLAWLRTLPASWKMISLSKLLVAFVALLAAWLLGTFLYHVQRSINQGIDAIQFEGGLSGQLLVFASLFLLSGFLTAYCFRSPVSGLLAVVPLMFGVLVVGPLAHRILEFSGLAQPGSNTATFVVLATLGTVLFVAQYIAAKRRLSGPDSSIRQRVQESVSMDAFRPPSPSPATWYGATLILERPTKRYALLWQASRQNFGALVLFTLAAFAGVLVAFYFPSNTEDFAILIVGAALVGIASLTFYGDSVRRRCIFLWDRGVPATLVWQTRVLPTLIAVALVVGLFLVNQMLSRSSNNDTFSVLVVILVGYSICQFVSQWSPRPVFAFFAAPVLSLLGYVVLLPLIDSYHDLAVWASLAVTPILLFASWRLMPIWLSGSTGRAYNNRFLGYLAVSIAVPYVLVLGGRFVTTPASPDQWQSQMMSFKLPERPSEDPRISIFPGAMPNERELFRQGGLENRFLMLERDAQFDRQIEGELADTESIGRHVSFEDVVAYMPSSPSWVSSSGPHAKVTYLREEGRQEKELQCARLLLKWARLVRNEARYGDASFAQVTRIAEQAEGIVARVLQEQLYQDGPSPEIDEVTKLFPDDSLVLSSRRNSLINAWQSYQRSDNTEKKFADYAGDSQVDSYVPWLRRSWIEQRRYERFVDLAVKQAERHWDSGATSSVVHLPGFTNKAHETDLYDVLNALTDTGVDAEIESLKARLK